jgi:hypothetical protein
MLGCAIGLWMWYSQMKSSNNFLIGNKKKEKKRKKRTKKKTNKTEFHGNKGNLSIPVSVGFGVENERFRSNSIAAIDCFGDNPKRSLRDLVLMVRKNETTKRDE